MAKRNTNSTGANDVTPTERGGGAPPADAPLPGDGFDQAAAEKAAADAKAAEEAAAAAAAAQNAPLPGEGLGDADGQPPAAAEPQVDIAVLEADRDEKLAAARAVMAKINAAEADERARRREFEKQIAEMHREHRAASDAYQVAWGVVEEAKAKAQK